MAPLEVRKPKLFFEDSVLWIVVPLRRRQRKPKLDWAHSNSEHGLTCLRRIDENAVDGYNSHTQRVVSLVSTCVKMSRNALQL